MATFQFFFSVGRSKDLSAPLYEGRGYRRVEKTTKHGTLCSVLHTKYNSDDQIKKKVIGGACGTCLGGRRGAYRVLLGRSEGRGPF